MAYSTCQRTAISRALQETDRPMTPHEIREAAQTLVASLGIAPVYRGLKELPRDGDARLIEVRGGLRP